MADPKFKKGLKTKLKILDTAKKLFYEKGFAKTSVKEICEISEIKSGNFTYYFPTKETLVNEIYTELYMKSYSFVGSKLLRSTNSIEKNVLASYPYFMGALKDARTIFFHEETLRRESGSMYLGQNLNHVYHQFVKDLKIPLTELEIKNLSYAELGLRRELTLQYIANPHDQSIYELIDIFLIYRARLMQMDEMVMRSYLYNALEFERKHDHSHICLLV